MNHQRHKWGFFTITASAAITVWAVWISASQQTGALGREWLTYGGDSAERRYSPLDQINSSNAGRLGLAWTQVVGSGGGNQEATPLFSNGLLYGITNWSIAFAIDARTGREVWRFDPQVDRAFTAPDNRGVCCGVINRGLALHDGKIIVPVIDGRLIAVDAANGKVLWTGRVLAENSTGYSLTMAPRVVKDKVIVGLAGAEFTPHRGFFAAFDVRTGKELWRFYTVPGDPSKPFENPALERAAKTWSGEWWKYGGGGSVWDGLSYDPEANLIYVGTGNGAPWPEALRDEGNKRLDNLYVCSILAVNPDNGALAWHYQVVPGDSWDFDSVQQMILADLQIEGRTRKVLMQANKAGFFYVLDRITGEFISATPFAPVNWAKGHDPSTGRPLVNPEAYYTTSSSVTISPAAGGAANWAAKAYSPQTGLVYMPVNGFSSRAYTAIPFELMPARALQVNGTPRGGQLPAGAPVPTNPPLIGPEGVRGGFLVAFDPVARKERWRVAGGGGSGGGALATAGNLVFQVLNDGRLLALGADDGRKLFESQTGQRGMGPPISYELDGKQYISFMGGTGQAGRGATAGASQPRMYTFVLDGKTPMPDMPQP
jgi:quinohemoprotein ethanol dehydrogenase